MARKMFAEGQAVEVQGVGRVNWRPAVYVSVSVRGRHIVKNGDGHRVVPDDRIRAVDETKGDREPIERLRGGWVKFEPLRCDLCTGFAVWQHRAGGLRCRSCPRPGDQTQKR